MPAYPIPPPPYLPTSHTNTRRAPGLEPPTPQPHPYPSPNWVALLAVNQVRPPPPLPTPIPLRQTGRLTSRQ